MGLAESGPEAKMRAELKAGTGASTGDHDCGAGSD
ncbi:hypothetical protein HD596_003648 [Nonomuraea jabiensis]|uniref:Uncharacterized protein n=1 Tax=Nonomuraea jabiensis TaxID=882448 RepID=A0A7W9LAP3_9ACTN|nr:hypothetical protein [Nonomuraea jabiensis]